MINVTEQVQVYVVFIVLCVCVCTKITRFGLDDECYSQNAHGNAWVDMLLQRWMRGGFADFMRRAHVFLRCSDEAIIRVPNHKVVDGVSHVNLFQRTRWLWHFTNGCCHGGAENGWVPDSNKYDSGQIYIIKETRRERI